MEAITEVKETGVSPLEITLDRHSKKSFDKQNCYKPNQRSQRLIILKSKGHISKKIQFTLKCKNKIH